MKKITKKSNINLENYVNIQTGETLVSEMSNTKTTLTASTQTGHVLISSDDYAVMNSEAVEYLMEVLNRSEMGSLTIMTTDLKTPLNLVYNNNVPHTNETLQQRLGISSRETFTKLIRKLMKLGILYQIKGNIMGDVRVIYMLNPFIARKRKTFDDKVFNIFKEIKCKDC